MKQDTASTTSRCIPLASLRRFLFCLMLFSFAWAHANPAWAREAASRSAATHEYNASETNTNSASFVLPVTADAGPDKFILAGQSTTIGGSPTATGGTPPYTYSWSPTAGLDNPVLANPTATVKSNKFFIVTVTDGNGDTDTDTVKVTAHVILKAKAGLDKAITLGQTVQIGDTPAATGGYPSYTYSWSPTTGLSNSAAARPNATPTTTTNYILTVQDIYNNTAKDTMTVFVNQSLNANAGSDKNMCVGDSVTLGGSPTAISGTGPYTYSWTPATGLSNASAANPKAAPAATTTYILQVTDASLSTAKDTVVVTVNPSPLADAGTDKFVLSGQPTGIGGSPAASGGTAPYSYEWTPISGLSNPTIANPTATVTFTRNYVLTVTDASGCKDTDTVRVNSRVLLVANAGPDKIVLPGQSTTIGVTTAATGGYPGYTYSWSPTTGLNNPTAKNPTATPGATTAYILTVTDTKGFTDDDTMIVFVGSVATANAGADKEICAGSSTTIGGSPTASSGTAPFSYNWIPATGLNDDTAANPTASPTTTTAYVVFVTDANSNTDTDTVLVTVNPSPVAAAGIDKEICIGTTTTIGGSPTATSGTPGYSYSWTPTTGLNDATAANPSASPAVTTSYVVLVTDAKSCSATDTVVVTVNPNPIADAGGDKETCVGAGVSIGGSPAASGGTAPYTYTWSPATGLNDANAANPIATPNVTTAYVLNVSDAKGCSDTDTVLVTVNPNPTADAGVDTAICAGGSATLGGSSSASGGTAPYTYAWSPATGLNDASGANPIASPSGTTSYILTVTDAKGCVDKDTVLVTVSSGLTADAGADQAISLGASANLGGAPTASGGTAPYTYSWSPTTDLDDATAANPVATPAASATYIVTVTDALGCTDDDTVNVVVSALPIADAGPDTAICAGDSVMIGGNPTASAGTAPYSYSWSPATGLSDASVANPKASPATTISYVVLVTDANSNTDTDTVLVTVSSGLTADAGADKAITSGASVAIGGAPTASGGIAPYAYSWAPATGLDDATAANPTATIAVSTTYIVTVTDAVGCTDTDTVNVNVSLLPTADAGPDTAICAGDSVMIGGSPTASAGTAPYSYSWSPATGLSNASAANPKASPAVATAYVVLVTDANSNTDTDTVLVTVNPQPIANAGADVAILLGNSTTLGGSPSASSGTAPYSYAWSPATGLNDATAANPLATPADTTTYVLTITDSKGCTDTDTVIVYVNSVNAPPTAIASASPTSGGAPLLVQFTGSGSTDTDGTIVSFAWDFGDGNTSTQADPQYTYNALGNRIARLIVTDNGGAKDTATVAINVIDCLSLPSAPGYGKIKGGDQTHVDKVTYCFTGGPGNMQLQYEVYDVDTNIEVEARVNGKKVFNAPITLSSQWSTALTAFIPDSVILDSGMNELVFDNTKNPTNTNLWGVRNVSIGPPPANQPPNAVASASPTIGPAPTNVQFTGSGSNDPDGTIASHAWNFGDGNTSTQANPAHTYNAAGIYSARLIVIDNGGAADTAFVSIEIVATCLSLPDTAAYGKITGGDQTHVDKVIYCFSGMAGDALLSYQVYDIDTNLEGDVFLNNKKIIDLDPSGDNAWSGTRTFNLPDSLLNDSATNVLVFDNTKNPPNANLWGVRQVSVAGSAPNQPPNAIASANPTSGLAPLNVQFTGSNSTDSDGTIASYAWTFGDGGSSTQADPLYAYNTPANYSARLIVTDNLGATDTAFVNVQVNTNLPPTAVASANVDSGAVPLAVNFTGSSSSDPDDGIASYLWSFGDGGSAATANASHNYTVAGNYIASLIVTDNGGQKDTATVNIKAQAPSGLPTIRVNAGGSLFTTVGGKVFSADQLYTPGSWGFIDSGFVRIETLAITGTPDPDLYRVQRERIQLDYRFDIPNGSYDVILHFAELKDKEALSRVMDVALEGVIVLDDFDLFVQAPGKGVAVQRRFNGITVADGQLHLNLVKSLSTYKRPCAIAAIEIGPAGVLPKENERDASAVTAEIPTRYVLEQNYPNPFNPSTNIVFSLPEAGEVKLVIYNANGQFVRKVVDQRMQAGRHTVRFNASKLPSGTYFYELQVNDVHVRRKMTLAR